MKDRSQPLTVKARIGIKQRIGLNMKLNSRAETFLRKINIAVEIWNGPKIVPSSLRAARSSARRLAMLTGIAKPKAIPMPNRQTATKIHLL